MTNSKRKLCYFRPLSGQLGNQFFQLNFLFQISNRIQATPIAKISDDVGGYLRSRLKSPTALDYLKPKSKKSLEEIRGFNESELLLNFSHLFTSGVKRIALPSGLLGESFFDYCYVDPKVFFQPKYSPSEAAPIYRLVLHFRGRDFLAWDPLAIMPPSYYLKAIDYGLSFLSLTQLDIAFVTDDPTHDTVLKVKSSYPLIQILSNAPAIDFSVMTGADFLVASPSTFSIWAALLGNSPKLLVSQDWLDYKESKSDKFWTRLRRGGNEFLSVYKEL